MPAHASSWSILSLDLQHLSIDADSPSDLLLQDRELAAEIVPSFIKLFNICKGPRKVILKRNANHEDYNRVIITKARGGDIEKLPQEVLEGAQVFVALHHQLLAELPPLLEGFATILDMVLKALAACHARFHRGVQDLLNGFWNEFPPVVMDVDSESAHVSSDGPAIIRVWEEASRVPTEMVEELAITRKSEYLSLITASIFWS